MVAAACRQASSESNGIRTQAGWSEALLTLTAININNHIAYLVPGHDLPGAVVMFHQGRA